MMPPIRHAPTTASVRSPVAASLPVVFLVMTFVVVVSVLGEGLGVGAGCGRWGPTAAEPKTDGARERGHLALPAVLPDQRP